MTLWSRLNEAIPRTYCRRCTIQFGSWIFTSHYGVALVLLLELRWRLNPIWWRWIHMHADDTPTSNSSWKALYKVLY
ncbi:hypothetical protein EJ08DRAFT_232711 [Tothia fuscella]|uniref:Uncharacterized protein n=1 Tax=Tothia fuscella TaxID=1048955 RepID=A0A9P4U4T4_9PEZI|nr:hypothetical protein EJ08DRAFT_232711 [Tothia fuscella]